ncbi:hypothetical protein L4D09_20285 [Photobacterium makurazakiensis]|uniref:hypothetical protein n=1 Tax=Photobacterium makurazakiensis TaxID=2910234 RepID=UPI003D0ADBA7
MRCFIYLALVFFPLHSQAEDNTKLPLNQYSALNVLAKFSVSSIELPIGSSENANTLKGDDLNQNTIRDDFERALLCRYTQPEFVAMGVLAAIKWSQLLNLDSNNVEQLQSNEIHEILNSNIAISQCYEQLSDIEPSLPASIGSYFNNQQRQQAKKNALKTLSSQLSGSPQITSQYTQPCDVFNVLAEEALKQPLILTHTGYSF